MKSFIAVAVLALVAVAAAQFGGHGHGHHGGHGHHHGHHYDIHAYPAYKYSYGVADKHTGDVKSASEVRDGAITKGHYSLIQPDGVLRTVTYVADKGGFQAQVHNKGIAGHPHVYHHHGHGGHHHGGHHHGHGGHGGFGGF